MTIGLSGVLSAFLVNDVVCVALTPLVLDLTRRLKRPPIPYLVGLATASNVGSVATITGNPQNIIIGSLSHISYLRFAARLAPGRGDRAGARPSRSSRWSTEDRLRAGRRTGARRARRARGSIAACWPRASRVTLATVGLFFAGSPIALVALGAAAVCCCSAGSGPRRSTGSVDWPLLVMFAGLFVVVHAFEATVVRTWGIERWHVAAGLARGDGQRAVGGALEPRLERAGGPAVQAADGGDGRANREQAWLALAMSSTLAGNLTVLGSVANLIVVENARRAGTELGFVEYLKVGVPLTILTTLVGVGWLALTHY